MKKLEYVDLKQSIEAVKEAISQASISLQINKVVLQALEKEIENYQPPLIKDKPKAE
jgi:hypothetical protein